MTETASTKTITKSYRLTFVLAAGVLLAYGTGLLRDYIFTNINKEIATGSTGLQPGDWIHQHLILFKWILTLLFSAWYLGISLMALNIVYGTKKYSSITIGFYAFLVVLSFMCNAAGYFFGKQEMFYRQARDIMGLVQSPALLMILVPAFLLHHKKLPKKK